MTIPTHHALARTIGVDLETDVEMTTSDGVVLRADVYRPVGIGRAPVLLMRVPYNKQKAQTGTFLHPTWYARQGYLVVIQDTRGRFASGGDFYPFRHEAADGLETVDWAAGLPGSNGRVGMYGLSYAGATQLQAAIGGSSALRAICPGITSSRYHEGWAYKGGTFNLAFNLFWAGLLATDGARAANLPGTRAIHQALVDAPARAWHLPLATMPDIAEAAPYFVDWLDHASYDDYWRRWSVDEHYPRIDTAALHIGGWYDIFAQGTVRNFDGIRAAGAHSARDRQKLLMGPWHHAIELSGSAAGHPASTDGQVDAWQIRWFDQFLRDDDTGVLDSDATVYFLGANRWEELSWPVESTRMRLHLHSAGRANSKVGDGTLSLEAPDAEPPDVYAYDPAFPTPSAGGTSCCSPDLAPMGAACQHDVESSNDVLVYTSEPLREELVVCGEVVLNLHAATSAEDTDFSFKLCHVTPGGASTNIAQGVIRGRYRDSLADPAPLTPYEVYPLRISAGVTAVAFPAGHRIRIQIASSDFPQWDRHPNRYLDLARHTDGDAVMATTYVLHDQSHPSHLELPVVSGRL